MKFPETLKSWRGKKSLVQKEAAGRLRVNLRTYEAWEAGRTEPNDLAKEELNRRMAAS